MMLTEWPGWAVTNGVFQPLLLYSVAGCVTHTLPGRPPYVLPEPNTRNATPTSAAMIISTPKNLITDSSGSVSPPRSLLAIIRGPPRPYRYSITTINDSIDSRYARVKP